MRSSLIFAIGALLALPCITACDRAPAKPPAAERSLGETIGELAAQGEALSAVPFPEVIKGATGRRVLPLDPADPVLQFISSAVGASVARLNLDSSPVRKLRRINEASRIFEDEIMRQLDGHDDLTCGPPENAAGKTQRSGYPDLKITHRPSGRVYYIDPKLLESGSLRSTLRTFYYEPKRETNKVLEDAHHLLIGIEHDGRVGAWQFTAWHLVDLSRLVVKLKPEFQASNRDIYNDAAIVLHSEVE